MPINLGSLAGGFAERAGEHLLEFALGAAVAEALRPEAVALGQEAWRVDPGRVLPAGEAAGVVAEYLRDEAWGAGEAAAEGFDGTRFGYLVKSRRSAPGVPMLLELWRRDEITEAELVHGLQKAKLEPEWLEPIKALRDDRLDPSLIATSVQRGVMHNAGLLPVGPPSAVGRITPMPVSDLDPVHEAAASGINRERLAVMARIVGLPPAPGELLQLVNRRVIEEPDYFRGIAEGNTRNEWAEALLELRRRILTPHEYVELRLRGWIDDAAMHAGAALSGLEAADADLLFKMLGRPIPVHQVLTGTARGGHYDGPHDGIPAAYLKTLQESNIRPEWYSLAYANRYSYPSAFVVRRLQQDGAMSRDEAEQVYLNVGWPPELADKVATAYATPAGEKADTHVGKAAGQLWTATHKAFVDAEATDAGALEALAAIGVAAPARPQVLALWRHERDLIRTPLTPAQIKKAAKGGIFTEAEAVARLEAQGMAADDARTLLAE